MSRLGPISYLVSRSVNPVRHGFSLLALCATAMNAGAQVPVKSAPAGADVLPASQKPWRNITVPDTYTLGPGDVLSVAVERFPQYSHSNITVAPDGKISLPVYGQFPVVNWTVAQVQTELRKRISNRLRRPEILSVSLTKPRARAVYSIYILGAGIRTQGAIPIQLNYRLSEALAKAGGLNGRPDEIIATLTRGDAAPITVKLAEALADTSGAANIRILPNDVLTLTPVEIQTLTIDGDVGRPGVYSLRRAPAPGASEVPLKPTLRDVVIASGGLQSSLPRPTVETGGDGAAVTPVNAVTVPDRFKGYILRGQQRIELSVSDVMDYSDRKANVALQPGDYIRIDAVPPTRIYLEGEVKNRGGMTIAPESGVIEAIAQAGGLTLAPNKVIASIRRGGQVIDVDLDRALLVNDPKSNIQLKQGDILIVSEEKSIGVNMVGELNRPGLAKLKPDTALTDAVAQSGGLRIDPTDARISLLRTLNDGKTLVLTIDPVALFRNNDLSQNVKLQDNDVVSVAAIKRNTVFVTGEVAQVGPQTIKEDESLADVLARAGGATNKASLTQIVVERSGQKFVVDAYGAIKEGGTLDFKLLDGDYILVPASRNNVMVMEAVAKPDFYPIPEKGTLTVLAAITAAGGPTADAKLDDIVVLRPNADGSKVETHVFSMKNIKKGDWRANEPLQPGDMVYVSRRTVNPSVLRSIAGYAGSVLSIARIGNIF